MDKCKELLEKSAYFYKKEGRMLPWRQNRDPYRVWLSEIMLQQTRIEAVIPYFEKFLLLFPTVFDLARADEDALFKAWEGLGYYSRARNLHRAAKIVVEEYGGVFPADYEALLSLPGVGEYTAAAIGSVCFSIPHAAIDGNVLRIYARVFSDARDISDTKVKKDIAKVLNAAYPEGDAAGYTTQGLMEIGQRFCIPNGEPKCNACPLRSLCDTQKNGEFARYPFRKPKRARKKLPKTVLLLHVTDDEGGAFLIRKRESTGLLGGLWEFPSVDEPLSPEEAMEHARALGVSPLAALPCGEGVHIFTHLEWHMRGVLIECAPTLPDGFTKATAKELKDLYPIASAFRVFKDFIFRELNEEKG